ncbi:MAG: ATP-dependent DNA helicase [Candidatus Saccharimonadales bacterium]
MSTEVFTNRYRSLNPKQKQAVDTIDGPLLVIAGPGTGKTELLSIRVANILKETDTLPQNILCLTFTNKAAANMRNRLQKLIRAESLQVNVKTFHSLSAELMGEYPDYFWNGARLTSAPDAIQTDIIEGILSKLPLDNTLAVKFAGNYTSITRVQKALRLAKEAGLTPEKLRAIIEVNLAYINLIEEQLLDILPDRLNYKTLNTLSLDIETLPNQNIDETVAPLTSLSTYIKSSLSDAIANDEGTNMTKYTGAWRSQLIQSEAKVRGMHKQRRANEWWLNLCDVYASYRDQLHIRGYYDYSDMIIEVISQLESQPAMLSDIQERYQYIMIDEFQDSNAAQIRLAHLIASHPLDEGKPNLMAVGDDDQSIYKFNGAELNNMLSFKRLYPTTKTIVLEDNYRSSQEVLDTAKQIIELAEDRLVRRDHTITKNLQSQNQPSLPSQIIHKSYPSNEHQLYGVAQLIHEEKTLYKTRSIAVLARSHDSLQTIAGILNSMDVPISYERQNNILDHVAVQQIIHTCRIIQGIQDGNEAIVNQSIAHILSHPMWGIDRRSLWKLAIDNCYRPHWLDSLLDNNDGSLKIIGSWLVWLSEQSSTSRIEIIMDYILGLRESENYISPFRQYFIDCRPANSEYVETLSAIQTLRSTVNEYAQGQHTKLDEFIRFVDLHMVNNIIIADKSIFASAQDAVQLLTVHKSKGLEFDSVYIVDAIEKEWQPKNKGSVTPINLPLQPYGDDMDDYIRLMYVATTRAKSNIIASSYRLNSTNEDVVASPLLTTAIPVEEISQNEMPNSPEILESNVKWPILETNDARQLLNPVLENFSLNVTALMNFLDVTAGGPQYFLERNLLRLPGARTISLAFGTAIHSTLEYAQRQIDQDIFDLEQIKAFFQVELEKEPVLPEELYRWKPHGLGLLDKLFSQHFISLEKGGTPEQKLHGIDIDGAVIDGKLDHINVNTNSKNILITDYKTGGPLRSFSSKDKSIQVKLWKHKTQLIFYALLAKNSPAFKNMNITCRMQYLEANNINDVTREYIPSNEEIERLAKLSRAVYKKIIDYDLPDIRNYSQDIDGILKFESDLISGQ